MAKTSYLISLFLRVNPFERSCHNKHVRFLSVEPKELGPEEVAKEVCSIIRRRPRWEQSLRSEYPSFDFSDPKFLVELLRHQNNAFLSLRFFFWLNSHNSFSLHPLCCNALFDALVDAKACNAAKLFLNYARFSPEPYSLERYVQCLSETGLIEEANEMLCKLKRLAVCPKIETWNSVFLGCVKSKRTDLIWDLYQEMLESGVKPDQKTVGYLIQTLCNENKAITAYEFLRQVLRDGLAPENAIFNLLIRSFGKEKRKISELLHAMIAKNCVPDVYTYQEVINAFCKTGKVCEAYQLFCDLKKRGYALDRVMYTTMIHGFCKMGLLGAARQLWFEMIKEGHLPNEYTYSTLICGYFKKGDFENSRRLFKKICDKGCAGTVSYNTMIWELCSNWKTDEAYKLFKEMCLKGILPDLITYNALILGFCKKNKIVKATNMLKELLTQGLQPSSSSYGPIIETYCKIGDMQEAHKLLKEMRDRGLKENACTIDFIIVALCDKGDVDEGIEWLAGMLKNNLKPVSHTFERLMTCLLQRSRLDDSLLILDFMFRAGYSLEKKMSISLVKKLSRGNCHFARSLLREILIRN